MGENEMTSLIFTEILGWTIEEMKGHGTIV
jgi:hypothetical protein